MTNINSLTDSEYRQVPLESFSSIKYLVTSPTAFKHSKETPFAGNAATIFGTCIHHYLQGNKHLVSFSSLRKIKKNLEAIELEKSEFLKAVGSEGLIVPISLQPKLEKIMRNFNDNKLAAELLNGCEFEKAYTFEIDNVGLKAKIDAVNEKLLQVIEIKSTSRISNASEFKEHALNNHYDLQAYLYLKATGMKKHSFIVVQTNEPFNVFVIKTTDATILAGEKKAKLAVERYKRYILGDEVWIDVEEEL